MLPLKYVKDSHGRLPRAIVDGKLFIFKPVEGFFPFSRHVTINISWQSLEAQERISGLVLTKYINRTAVHWKVSVH